MKQNLESSLNFVIGKMNAPRRDPTGAISPTATIFPAKIIQQNGSHIRPMFFLMDSTILLYQTQYFLKLVFILIKQKKKLQTNFFNCF